MSPVLIEREAVLNLLMSMVHASQPNTGPDPDPGECECDRCQAFGHAITEISAFVEHAPAPVAVDAVIEAARELVEWGTTPTRAAVERLRAALSSASKAAVDERGEFEEWARRELGNPDMLAPSMMHNTWAAWQAARGRRA